MFFSKLASNIQQDALPILDAKLAASSKEHCSTLMQAGWLPVINIGLVVHENKVIGQLGAVLKRLAFSKKTHRAHKELLSARTASKLAKMGTSRPTSASLDAAYDWNMPGIIDSHRYPTNAVEDGVLLSIRSAHSQSVHLVLPCPEIFRVMYAPHRIMALALLAGPWSMNAEKAIDISETKVVDDGSNDPSWRVATVEGLGSDHAAVVANLWLGVAGHNAANGLWEDIHATTGRRGAIAAVVPFEWETLELEVACIELEPRGTGKLGTWFGYAINAVRWPDAPLGPPSKIEWLPDRRPPSESPGEKNDPPDPPRPPTDIPTPDPNAELLDGDQGTDPSDDAGSVDIVGNGPVWLNSPEIVPLKRKPYESSGGSKRGGRNEQETTDLSAGANERGKTPSALGQPQAIDPYGGGGIACDRFELVLAMLNRLAKKGSISPPEVVSPPKKQAAKRGDQAVWAFPDDAIFADKIDRWYVRDFRNPRLGTREVRRTAMVLSIVIDLSTVYWIEIEPRVPKKSFHALIFTETGTMRLDNVITKLLSNAALVKGVWPESKLLQYWVSDGEASGISGSAVWRHSASRAWSSLEQGNDSDRILNHESALQRLKAVSCL